MKKDFSCRKRLCSDFDDRPIFELEDNLYPDALDNNNYQMKKYPDLKNKQHKKSEIIKNSENE